MSWCDRLLAGLTAWLGYLSLIRTCEPIVETEGTVPKRNGKLGAGMSLLGFHTVGSDRHH